MFFHEYQDVRFISCFPFSLHLHTRLKHLPFSGVSVHFVFIFEASAPGEDDMDRGLHKEFTEFLFPPGLQNTPVLEFQAGGFPVRHFVFDVSGHEIFPDVCDRIDDQDVSGPIYTIFDDRIQRGQGPVFIVDDRFDIVFVQERLQRLRSFFCVEDGDGLRGLYHLVKTYGHHSGRHRFPVPGESLERHLQKWSFVHKWFKWHPLNFYVIRMSQRNKTFYLISRLIR